MVCLEGVPDGVLNAPEFPGFQEILQNEVWERGAHRKDTGNIGNNRGTWEMTGVPFTVAELQEELALLECQAVEDA